MTRIFESVCLVMVMVKKWRGILGSQYWRYVPSMWAQNPSRVYVGESWPAMRIVGTEDCLEFEEDEDGLGLSGLTLALSRLELLETAIAISRRVNAKSISVGPL